MSSPLLAEPGAVAGQDQDAGVAAHYGDPFAEQRALALRCGLVDRSHRGVLRITGPDRLSWLHSLTTQHLEKLPAGQTAEALVLSPQGHVEHHLTLTDDGTAIWAHVEPGTLAALLQFLTSMKFMLRVEAQDVTADYGVLTVLGPQVPAALTGRAPAERAGGSEGTSDDAAPWAARLNADLGPGLPGADLIVPRSGLAAVAARLRGEGAELAGLWAYEALRIAAGRPRFGLDTDHRTIPHEVGWIETAVHLNKGCYRGQETVARVHNLGHPPRRLVLLHLDGSEDRLPGHGTPVTLDDDAPAGFTGSAGRHYELGPIALAMVKRTTPADATLRADGIPAAQEVIVSPDAGANIQIELKRRRGDLMGRPRE
jgi:folate-binding protein YgfZ